MADKLSNTLSDHIASMETGTWTELTTPASTGVTIAPTSNYAASGYIIRCGMCFVNLNIELASAQGDTSKAVVAIPVAPIKNTLKPPDWSSFANGNRRAESLLQSGYLYIRNAVAGAWAISFCFPVSNP